tara:strand:- start:300 stop:704 length:405 start_codon:yes stop_codon:yes gene_type:complete
MDSKKPKKKLSEKQLDALSKGRARASEKRKQKKINDDMEKEAIVLKKEQRSVAKNKKMEQNTLEKIRIREREERKREDIIVREERWKNARVHALDKCKTESQFKAVSEILDEVDFQDFGTDDGISKRFIKYKKK